MVKRYYFPEGIDEHYFLLRKGGFVPLRSSLNLEQSFVGICEMILHDVGALYWKPHCQNYREKFGAWCYRRVRGALKQAVKDITRTALTRKGAVKKIYDYVANNIRYSDTIGFDYPRFPLETLIHGIGDCEDKSMLLAALLKLAGFQVAMTYIDDEKHDFCHAFCFINAKRWFKDEEKLWKLDHYPKHGYAWLPLDPTFNHNLGEEPSWIKKHRYQDKIPFTHELIIEYSRVKARGYRVKYKPSHKRKKTVYKAR